MSEVQNQNQNQKGQGQKEQDINQLLKVRREKLANLQEAGKDPFVITKYDVTHHSMDIKDNFEAMEGQVVSVAGRIMQKRVMGKASFCNIQDLKGNIQSYVARDSVGEEPYADFKSMTSVISLVSKVKSSVLRWAKFLFMQVKLLCFQRVYRFYLKNSMV